MLIVKPVPSSASLFVRLVLMALLWAGTFVAGRALAGEMTPLAAATARFVLASVCLMGIALQVHGRLPRPSASQLLGTAGLGATGVVLYNLFFFASLAEQTAARSAIFVVFNPVIVAAMTALAFKECPTPATWAGLTIALFGAILVALSGASKEDAGSRLVGVTTGDLLMFGAVLSWGAYTLIGRVMLFGLSPLLLTTYAVTWGAVILLALQLGVDGWPRVPDLQTTSAVLYLALAGTVLPFIWYIQGVAQLGAARTAGFMNLVPVFGVVLGVLLLGERVSPVAVMGGVLALAGVYWANRPPKLKITIGKV